MDSDTLLAQLYLTHRQPLLEYTRRLTGDTYRAEDVVQETLLRAWLNAATLWIDRPTAIRAWLYRVARNIAVDDARAVRARPAEVYGTTVAPAVADPADDVVAAIEVASVLRRLPATHRRVLVQVFLRDQTLAATADRLGIPIGTAKSRLRNGLRQLRTSLQTDGLAPRLAPGLASGNFAVQSLGGDEAIGQPATGSRAAGRRRAA
jgi:RNA polymerase sigma-70 factor, ECF subfamily